MRFWNREKEKEWLKRYLKTEPNAILFVYGPKSSGKTTLLMKTLDELTQSENFSSSHSNYWFDLRGKLISNYRDIVDLFFMDEEAYRTLKEGSRRIEAGFAPFFKVSMESKRMIEEKRLDPFIYMEEVLKKQEKTGIIVFDELQKLKEVYMNGESRQRPLVRELFNFFVRLTKVLHLSHVIVMTSDTFFIENVYVDSTLKNTSEFYLVDFFDDETAVRIMTQEGMDEKTARDVIDRVGGVPWIMERILSNGNPSEKLQELYLQFKARLIDFLSNENKKGRYEKAIETLRKSVEGNLDPIKDRDDIELLVGYEILFYDPLKGIVRFQTRLDERAAREILEVE